MSKLEEKDILGRLKVWRGCAVVYLSELWTKKDDRVYKRIVELIKIFFAKEISSGPIKKDISRPVLIEWLQGINQAATVVKDHYVMKATTQLIAMLQKPQVTGKWIEEKAVSLIEKLAIRGTLSINFIKDFFCSFVEEIQIKDAEAFIRSFVKEMPTISKGWLPTAENINALPEPVRKYIHDIETNCDPAGMVQDNIIMKDTIKALEIKCEEWPEIKARETRYPDTDREEEWIRIK